MLVLHFLTMFTHSHAILSFLLFSLFLKAPAIPSADIEFVLGCGSDGGIDGYGRKWESDAKFAPPNTKTAMAQVQDSSLPSDIPYMKARIFTSDGTYKINVKPSKRHIIRLHFYPSAYNDLDLDPTNSYFSVVAAGITLLKNFSAAITTKALTQGYLVKEYSLVTPVSGTLDIIFKPENMDKGGYAFVNGIEVIPVPDDLFYQANMVGFDEQAFDIKSAPLQTMYRLNCGGQFIPPMNDSGLFRTWYDDMPYLYGAATGIASPPTDTQIQYKKIAHYFGTNDVYSTYRSMGDDPSVTQSFNLTWQFQVDANFTYVVRVHLCDTRNDKPTMVMFDIFVNNQTAASPVDVAGMAEGKGIPIVQDFASRVSDKQGDELLWVAVHPNNNDRPQFLDAFVNGIEVFKMADSKKNLAGPNPQPSEMMLEAEAKAAKTRAVEADRYRAHVIGGAAGGATVLAIVAAICFVFYQRKKRSFGTDSQTISWLPIYGNSHTSGTRRTGSHKSHASNFSSLAQGMCRFFTLAEIKKATKNFDESYVIGVGGFGKVYKGVIDGGTKVAIKRSNPSSEQGVHEFETEIEMLSKLRHKHLVSLMGFCEESEEMCLVYDYMAQGTLREHLYKSNKPPLSWKQRLEICIGSARGLHYLHTGAKYTIIHRDVKTTNILLDENLVAKVSDFGLSKTGPNMDQGHVSTVVKGSFGYLDPEYFKRQQLTEKSDVYSFGVVLFEVLCGRPALNPSLSKEQVSLADWALSCQKKGTLQSIIDPHLKGKIEPECLKKFATTAEKCLADHGLERPSMGDVLWNLEFALQLQDNADSSIHSSQTGESITSQDTSLMNYQRVSHINNSGMGSESGETSVISDDCSTGAIFSQIGNPTGR